MCVRESESMYTCVGEREREVRVGERGCFEIFVCVHIYEEGDRFEVRVSKRKTEMFMYVGARIRVRVGA